MSGDGQIRMSQGYDVLPPKSGQAFPIPCDEWDLLKSRLGQAVHSPWGFHTFGSLLLGAALSTLVTILVGGIPAQGSNPVVAWAVVLVCALSGSLCIYFADRESKLHKVQVGNIVSQMEVIERRFQRSPNPATGTVESIAIQSAQYGAGGAAVDVTSALTARIDGSGLHLKVGNDLAGDPCPGTAKELVLEYVHNGQLHKKQVKEHDWLRIP